MDLHEEARKALHKWLQSGRELRFWSKDWYAFFDLLVIVWERRDGSDILDDLTAEVATEIRALRITGDPDEIKEQEVEVKKTAYLVFQLLDYILLERRHNHLPCTALTGGGNVPKDILSRLPVRPMPSSEA